MGGSCDSKNKQTSCQNCVDINLKKMIRDAHKFFITLKEKEGGL